ncbi:MAG: hypothetical protein RIT45_1542 [Pseudomonadota bacterium]|jgi:hypothetical protein
MTAVPATPPARARGGATWRCFGWLLGVGLAACEPDVAGGPTGAAPERALVVVGGDYQSTVVSRIDVERAVSDAPAFLHSGSVVGETGSALSGDVVPGRVLDGSGDALLVDRAKGTVTRLKGLGVHWQRNVAPGFSANPQDAIAVHIGDERRVLVVRGQPDVHGGSNDSVLGGGDDLVVLGHDGVPLGRLALGSAASAPPKGGAVMAMAGSGAWTGDALWLPLASVSPAFDGYGPGRLVQARVAADGATSLGLGVELGPLRNCRAARRLAGPGLRLGVVCSGSFAEGPAEQLAGSGLAVVRIEGDAAAVERVVPAANFGAPLGFHVAVSEQTDTAVVVALGDLEAGQPDAVWAVDVQTGAGTSIALGRGAFTLGGLWLDATTQTLWVADSGISTAGDLRRFRIDAAGWQELDAVASVPGGLRALELAPW